MHEPTQPPVAVAPSVANEPPSRGEPSENSEDAGKQALRSAVAYRVPQLQACYGKGLRKEPDLRGTVIVSITVLPTGTVDAVTAEVETGSHLSKVVTACIEETARGWGLPTLSATEPTTISFGVEFAPSTSPAESERPMSGEDET